MKCPICGYVNGPGVTTCSRCKESLGASFQSDPRMADNTPDWRKEVTSKLKAYNERKKKLITPPYPLNDSKDSANDPLTSAVSQNEEIPSEPAPPAESLETSNSITLPSHQPETFDVWAEDLTEQLLSENEPSWNLHLGRRSGAFFVDALLLVILLLTGIYTLSFLSGGIQIFDLHHPTTLLCVAMAAHFVYYVSFCGTSRQTPGQLFFSLEIRSGSSLYVPFWRIVLRWLLFWLLNLLNLLPLLFGRKYLYLDVLSGTGVYSLKK